VLADVRAGLRNGAIAARRGISVNTVRTHISSMLSKLELRNRRELAAWEGGMSGQSDEKITYVCSFRAGRLPPKTPYGRAADSMVEFLIRHSEV